MALGNGRLSTQYHDSSVLRETAAQTQNDEQASETTGPTEFAYTPEERTAINQANEAFTPVIKAVDTFENVEAWVPPLIRGVRALRDRAVRETGAVNYMDHQYRKKFGDLLNAEPIGPWLLDEHRRSLLDAVHYLGSDDTCLDTFMEWLRTKVTAEQRKKWRTLRTLVDHFKRWQSGTVPNKDRRTANQKAIERIRTEGHKADAALLAEVNQARQELANGTIESMATRSLIMLDRRNSSRLSRTTARRTMRESRTSSWVRGSRSRRNENSHSRAGRKR